MKLVWVVLFCSCFVSMAMANCRFIKLEHEKGDDKGICEYKDVTRLWRFEINSIIQSPPPMCEKCICAKRGMFCCGYGKKKGEMKAVPPHCKLINKPGSCEFDVVRIDDENKEC